MLSPSPAYCNHISHIAYPTSERTKSTFPEHAQKQTNSDPCIHAAASSHPAESQTFPSTKNLTQRMERNILGPLRMLSKSPRQSRHELDLIKLFFSQLCFSRFNNLSFWDMSCLIDLPYCSFCISIVTCAAKSCLKLLLWPKLPAFRK